MGRPELWIPFVAVLGGCIGSFLNVVIYRLPLGLSVAEPRWSFCPRCARRIRAGDNLPVLGWLRLRGRCRCAVKKRSQRLVQFRTQGDARRRGPCVA